MRAKAQKVEKRLMGGALVKAFQRMYKAWGTWIDNATELRRQRSQVEKMALRMRNAGMYTAWAS